jgi:DNA-binding NtrC family response regulator
MSFGCVLVLNPNKAHAQVMATMLQRQKWTSVLSFDQSMAMRIMKGSQFRLLLFEAYVGGASIMQSIDKIRELADETPLAIMTDGGAGGQALKSTLELAKTSGADFTMARPFSDERLKVLLNETNAFHRARATDRHVLVVEDNTELRRAICMVLKQVGYVVSSAVNMEDAFFDHNLGSVDIVLTSILIPGIGGIEGTAQIRRDFPHVRVVAMSQGINDTIGPQHILAAATSAGAIATIAKPFHMGDLLRTLGGVLKMTPEGEAIHDPMGEMPVETPEKA